MKKFTRHIILIFLLLFLSSCVSDSVKLVNRFSQKPSKVTSSYPVSAEACGFQLLLFIPIEINNRMTRAMTNLETKSYGGYLTNFSIEESWSYGLVGTQYCTKISAIVEK